MAICRLDRVHATYNGNLESVQSEDNLKNGYIGVLGALVTGEREIKAFTKPATATLATDIFVLHCSPEVMYDPTKGLKDFEVEAGKVGRAYHFTVGDIITITVDLFVTDSDPDVGKYAVPANGTYLWGVSADGKVGEVEPKLVGKIIEKTTLGYDNTEAYAIEIIKC